MNRHSHWGTGDVFRRLFSTTPQNRSPLIPVQRLRRAFLKNMLASPSRWPESRFAENMWPLWRRSSNSVLWLRSRTIGNTWPPKWVETTPVWTTKAATCQNHEASSTRQEVWSEPGANSRLKGVFFLSTVIRRGGVHSGPGAEREQSRYTSHDYWRPRGGGRRRSKQSQTQVNV